MTGEVGVSSSASSNAKRSLTAILLFLYNVLLLVFALILIAASAYVSSQFRDNSWQGVVTQEMSSAGIVAGVLTGLVSLLGLFAATKRSRRVLCAYIICLVIIISLQLSAAAGLTIYSTQFNIRDDKAPSGSLTTTMDITINNMVFSVYTLCCTGCMPGVCNNPELPPNMFNVTNTNCQNTTCAFVSPCTTTSQGKCFKYAANTTAVVPPYVVNTAICDVLGNFKGPRSSRLVGKASTGACGLGDPTRFLQDLDAWASAGASSAATVFYVIASLEIIVLLAGVYLICFASRATVQKLTGFNVDEADEEWQA